MYLQKHRPLWFGRDSSSECFVFLDHLSCQICSAIGVEQGWEVLDEAKEIYKTCCLGALYVAQSRLQRGVTARNDP